MVYQQDFNYTPKGVNRRLHIYLPDDYDVTDERYPVMYFFDGHNLFFDSDATYGKSWGMNEFLRSWTEKMIVVGMECGHEGMERLDEYCPYDMEDGGFMGRTTGLGDLTVRWIMEDVKPYIDSALRTMPEREHTGIGGSSMGGLMSLYAAVRYNEVFSRALCMSTAMVMVMDRLHWDIGYRKLDPDTCFYLSWGTKEIMDNPGFAEELARMNREIAFHLREQNAEAFMRCLEGGRHCEADWEKLLPEGMSILWQ